MLLFNLTENKSTYSDRKKEKVVIFDMKVTNIDIYVFLWKEIE